MRVLFVNSVKPRCGVAQYGINLFNAIKRSKTIGYVYTVGNVWPDPTGYDAIIYNWHYLHGGWQASAPFDFPCPQLIVYHENCDRMDKFDGIIFSDPTQTNHDKWHFIGRPVPEWPMPMATNNAKFTVGTHGINGDAAMEFVMAMRGKLHDTLLRIHIPDGDYVKSSHMNLHRRARDILNGTTLSVEFHTDFFPKMEDLIEWLSQNDMNCYVRNTAEHWMGVSSALDAAIACGRPLAINKCEGFRHLHQLKPSLCIEDRPLHEIFLDSVKTLAPLRQAWSPHNIARQVDEAVMAVIDQYQLSHVTAKHTVITHK